MATLGTRRYRYRTIYLGDNLCPFCGRAFRFLELRHQIQTSKGNIHRACWTCFRTHRERIRLWWRNYNRSHRQQRRETARQARLRNLTSYRARDRHYNAQAKRKRKKLAAGYRSYWKHRDEILARRARRKKALKEKAL